MQDRQEFSSQQKNSKHQGETNGYLIKVAVILSDNGYDVFTGD